MKTKNLFRSSLMVLTFFILTSCSSSSDSDSGTPTPSNRTIKYEITGTYSGQLDVVYTDVNGNNMSEVITTLPWSRTLTYPSNISTVAIGSSSVIAHAGVAGQSGSMKIYQGETVKRTSNKVVGENGLLIFDTQTYTIP